MHGLFIVASGFINQLVRLVADAHRLPAVLPVILMLPIVPGETETRGSLALMTGCYRKVVEFGADLTSAYGAWTTKLQRVSVGGRVDGKYGCSLMLASMISQLVMSKYCFTLSSTDPNLLVKGSTLEL